MKSKIKFPWFTPKGVKSVYLSVISEWEEFTGGKDDFCVYRYTKGGYAVRSGGAHLRLSCNSKGTFEYFCNTLHKSHRGVGLNLSGDNFVRAGSIVHQNTSLGVASTRLGLQDITDIQPYEWGLLKLKWGLDKNSMFIPTEVVKQVKLYKESRVAYKLYNEGY